MITGRMAMATIMYTLPISNFRKSALRDQDGLGISFCSIYSLNV